MSTPTRIMNAGEVAKLLAVNRETVYRLARDGELPCFHIGSTVRFSENQIFEWIQNELTKETKEK